jgi:hypothetical protein
MKNFFQKAWPVLSTIFSVLVIVLCIASIAVTWVLEGAVSSASVKILGVVETSTVKLREGVEVVDTKLETLEETVTTIETASEKISSNVNDKGLILTLLPIAKERLMTDASESVKVKVDAIYDLANYTEGIMQAFTDLPFVNVPTDGLAAVVTLPKQMERMKGLIEDLKTGIDDFRTERSDNISKITDALTKIHNLVTEARTKIALLDAELVNIQVLTEKLQKWLPVIIISSSIAMTLLAVWIGYTQVLVIMRYRKSGSQTIETSKSKPHSTGKPGEPAKTGKSMKPAKTESAIPPVKRSSLGK